jgi:hypothetical protein
MPAVTYDTTLDPNGGTLFCSPPAPCEAGSDADEDGGSTCSTQPTCPAGYACSGPNNTCVIPLTGGIGLAINSDGTHWWDPPATSEAGAGEAGATKAGTSEAGTCDESCQRWVSACVLARTNAYGVHVEISMRASSNLPPGSQSAQIQAALATSQAEVAPCQPGTDPSTCGYTLREGAYYGNIFETTPTPVVCSGPPSSCTATGPPSATCYTECLPASPLPAAPDGGAYTGPASGPIASTPNFYACAGPDSNVPEITKRFCSSQGDQAVINVPGVCVTTETTTETETGVCDGMDNPTTGAVYGCYTVSQGTGTRYDEVITVYLQQPIAVCGNGVCEPPGESATSCPSDCHPGTWAKSVDGDGTQASFDYGAATAVDPVDGSTVVAGVEFGSSAIVVDNTVSPPITLPATSDALDLVLIKYDSTGKYLWGERVPVNTWGPYVAEVSIGPDESIFLAGRYSDAVSRSESPSGVYFAKFTKDGSLASGLPPLPATIALSGAYPNAVGGGTSRVDSNGDLIVIGNFLGPTTFGAISLTNTTSGDYDMFVEKVCGGMLTNCTLGDVLWASVVGVSEVSENSLAVDGNNDVLAAGYSGTIYKLSGQTGAALWSNHGFYVDAVASDPIDPSYDVYALGNGQLAKYSADGKTLLWETELCATSCTGLRGMALAFDGAGNVITSGEFGPFGTANFGSGIFTSYAFPNLFAAAYRELDGGFSWSKGIPMILGGPPPPSSFNSGYLSFQDSLGHLVFGGAFSGSMELDGQLLVSALPESTSIVNAFVGSFQPPSTADTTPPCIGEIGTCSSGPTTVPSNILGQATSQCGALVFFMPPTAIDNGDPDAGAPPPGASVACSPPPNTIFAIGTTPVTCTATDALGNSSSATFKVTIVDTTPPVLTVPQSFTAPATGPSGATVTFTTTATDQVDCSTSASPASGPACTPTSSSCVPVTCTGPASGSVFPIGPTAVSCTATDSHGNTASATFTVTVTPACTPTTCSAQGANCGTSSDGCGGTLNCGTCTGPQTCGGGGATNVCGCTPATSCPAGENCGTSPNGCGGTINCGSCAAPQTCGGGGTANACGCTPATTCPAGENCGTSPNGCGSTLSCGSCAAPQTCGGGGAANVCGCTPTTCSAEGANCGEISNGCGGTINCGSCTPVVTVPANISAQATSASGAVVTFTATATDPVYGSLPVTCSPASGSTFSIGTTAVKCTATDKNGNTGTASFTVTVTGQPTGDACTAANQCASGFCVTGVCCNTACGGGTAASCEACSVALGASANGTCSTITTKNLSSSGVCSGAVCTSAGKPITGNITVPASDSCVLIGAYSGNVTASKSSSLTLAGASVQGNVQATNSASVTFTAGSSVGGNVQTTDTGSVAITSATISGNAQATACGTFSLSSSTVKGNVQVEEDTAATTVTGDTVSGNVQIEEDAKGVVCSGNKVQGNIQIEGNTGGVSVTGNTWGGNLQCQENVPPAAKPASQCGG